MTKYIYHGPLSGVTLKDSTGIHEAILFPGRTVELPETNPYVQTLVAQKRLTPVPAPAPAPAPKES